MATVKLNEEWKKVLADEFKKDYIHDLKKFILKQKQDGKIVFPAGENIFNALDSTPISQVKAVILGQDPYHGPNQAHGLCFSVKKGVAIPPSLRNIYKELQQDIGFKVPNHGNLQSWDNQGVLLLNYLKRSKNRNKLYISLFNRTLLFLNIKFKNNRTLVFD